MLTDIGKLSLYDSVWYSIFKDDNDGTTSKLEKTFKFFVSNESSEFDINDELSITENSLAC